MGRRAPKRKPGETAKNKYTEQIEMMLDQKYSYGDENVSWEAEERGYQMLVFSGKGIA